MLNRQGAKDAEVEPNNSWRTLRLGGSILITEYQTRLLGFILFSPTYNLIPRSLLQGSLLK